MVLTATLSCFCEVFIHERQIWVLNELFFPLSSCLQAQDARGDHAVEPGLRPRRHRHPGGGGEEADEGEGSEPSRPGQGEIHRGSLEVEE